LTGATYVPPGNYRDREVLSERQLLSLLLQARLTEKDPKILRLAIDWYMLVPSKDADRNLEYVYVHYVEWLNSENLLDHAMTFVRHYKNRFESNDAMRKSVQGLLQKQILVFIRKKKLSLAEQLLDESSNVLVVDLKQAMAEILLAKAMQEGKSQKQYSSALDLTLRLVANGHLPKARADSYINYLNAQKQALSRGK
jgi:hypothetical protein